MTISAQIAIETEPKPKRNANAAHLKLFMLPPLVKIQCPYKQCENDYCCYPEHTCDEFEDT
jgi:hypothetical protein